MKKTFALILALVMILCILGGCTAQEAEDVPSAETASQSAAAQTEEPAEAVEATEAVEEPEEPQEVEEVPVETYEKQDYSLPLEMAGTEFSWFWVNNGMTDAKAMENLYFWNEFQNQTGVTIQWTQPSSSNASTQYNLMIAGGEYTDLIWESGVVSSGQVSAYTTGYDMAIEDDVYVDLTELIPQLAPNYNYYIHEDEDILKSVTTDGGKLAAFYHISSEPSGIQQGLYVRGDLLDATGMELPTTVEGWDDVLLAMKDNGVTEPLFVDNSGVNSTFANAFGTSVSCTFKVDNATGQLVFDGTSQEYRDYVEWFADMYSKGLTSESFISDDTMDPAREKVMNGVCATYNSMYSFDVIAKQNMGVDLVAVPAATVGGAAAPKLIDSSALTSRASNGACCAITTSCEDVDAAVKFLDFFYSDTGAKAANYGWNEGESYMVEDGVVKLESTMNDVDRETRLTGIVKFTMDAGPFYEFAMRRVEISAESSQNNVKAWSDIDVDNALYSTLPEIGFTNDETDTISRYGTDIATTMEEITLSWMMGLTELNDSTWQEYIDKLYEVGLAEYEEAYASAWARYSSR